MSTTDTPRTDALIATGINRMSHDSLSRVHRLAQELERELAAAKDRAEKAEALVTRLEGQLFVARTQLARYEDAVDKLWGSVSTKEGSAPCAARQIDKEDKP